MIALDNPDWLALVLCGLHDLLSRRVPLPVTDDPTLDRKLVQSYAPLLDSIARPLVFKNAQQVALAFKPAGAEEPPTFILAQHITDCDDKVRRQLVNLASHLRKIRALYAAQSHGQSLPPDKSIIAASATDKGLELALMIGEVDALHYCWKKSKARFTKENRYEFFLNLVADVQGDPADQRPNDPDGVRRTLKALQECSAADQARLKDVRLRIERIRDLVLSYDVAGTDKPTHEDLQVLVCAAKQAAPMPFDVGKWLNKVVSVTRDFVHILRVAQSPTMAPVLFGDQPEVILVPNPQPPRHSATISTSMVKIILRKAGWTDVDDGQYKALVENLRRNLTANETATTISDYVPSPDNPGSVSGELNSFVHCECALLAHLHNSRDISSILPYVGVSKLSCWLCWTYFECCRAVTNTRIRTRGTHGDLVAWQTPRDLDAAVDLC
ncbi:hypothetical protein C8T65DRAFT_830229 [Cerioporus squamosus]|nr:hypothetical protein C8T65DRAFT_830229 [Cerioporus squamosus]